MDGPRWRSGASEREAPYGDRNEGHSEHQAHQGHGITGAIDAIKGGIRNAFRGLKGYTRSDERIREDVCDRINHLSEQAGMDVSEVEVRVHEGEVTLAGSIENRQFKHRVENEAERIGGVRNVHNEIRVRRSSLDFEGRSTLAGTTQPTSSSASPTATQPSTDTGTATGTATATAGALSGGMIGTAGSPGAAAGSEKTRTPNGRPL